MKIEKSCPSCENDLPLNSNFEANEIYHNKREPTSVALRPSLRLYDERK